MSLRPATGLIVLVILVGCSSPSISPSSSSPTASPTATVVPTAFPTPTITSPPPLVRCPLNGLPVGDPSIVREPALLVQIENNSQARPPANLGFADLVVEAPVEGDVTRYSAVFLCQTTIGLTGPIRSARYYNVDLWQDMHVLTVCFGASNGALAAFREAGMPIVNGVYGQWPYFERGAGARPHNLYGDLEALRSSFGADPALDRQAAGVGDLRPPFQFDPDVAITGGAPVVGLSIKTNPYWTFGWQWSAEQNAWNRIDGGELLTDRTTGAVITARSVVVQRVRQDIVYGDPDPGGNARRYQHLVGSGEATLFVDGQSVPLTWSRPTSDDQTSWTVTATGDGLVLPPGVVWWEIVPTTASVTVE